MIPSEYTKDKRVVTFAMEGPADDKGTRRFEIFWWHENFHAGPAWRAQVFRANPEPHISKWKEQGFTVRVIPWPRSGGVNG